MLCFRIDIKLLKGDVCQQLPWILSLYTVLLMKRHTVSRLAKSVYWCAMTVLLIIRLLVFPWHSTEQTCRISFLQSKINTKAMLTVVTRFINLSMCKCKCIAPLKKTKWTNINHMFMGLHHLRWMTERVAKWDFWVVLMTTQTLRAIYKLRLNYCRKCVDRCLFFVVCGIVLFAYWF